MQCFAKVVIPPSKKVKIGQKTINYIFISYAHNSSAYQFLVYELNIPDIHKNTNGIRNTSFFNMCLHVNSSIIQVRLNEHIMLSLKIVKTKNKKKKRFKIANKRFILNLDVVREPEQKKFLTQNF